LPTLHHLPLIPGARSVPIFEGITGAKRQNDPVLYINRRNAFTTVWTKTTADAIIDYAATEFVGQVGVFWRAQERYQRNRGRR
jgi:hypothetical protein